MDNIEYLFAGFAVFWGGLFIYLLLLQLRIRALSREIERLEDRLAESEPKAPPSVRSTSAPAERGGAIDRIEATEQPAEQGA